MNLYFDPARLGYTILGEIEWGEAYYSYDLTVIWQSSDTGKLYYAEDSGCSCPCPFEDTGIPDLIEITTPQVIIDQFDKRISEIQTYRDDVEKIKGDAGELTQKIRAALQEVKK